jgi:hypothetical protein
MPDRVYSENGLFVTSFAGGLGNGRRLQVDTSAKWATLDLEHVDRLVTALEAWRQEERTLRELIAATCACGPQARPMGGLHVPGPVPLGTQCLRCLKPMGGVPGA